jgi:hypothetical protein
VLRSENQKHSCPYCANQRLKTSLPQFNLVIKSISHEKYHIKHAINDKGKTMSLL